QTLFFICSRHPPDLHSFPTRRSSDLRELGKRRCQAMPKSFDERFLSRPAIEEACDFLRCRKALEGRLFVGRKESCGNTQASSIADRKSTRLNSSHVAISYAVFCLKKK